jgi:hypothetical protein
VFGKWLAALAKYAFRTDWLKYKHCCDYNINIILNIERGLGQNRAGGQKGRKAERQKGRKAGGQEGRKAGSKGFKIQ